MKSAGMKMKCALAFVISGALAAGPVMADKPDWASSGKGGKRERVEQRDNDGRASGKRDHFQEQHRAVVREYYAEEFRGGRCPPGLQKKNNGCMPPGQARKWQIGRPLPHDVTYYAVPQPLVVQIGVPPQGYRYVRVAGDILMVAIGTDMVVDAIRDLGR